MVLFGHPRWAVQENTLLDKVQDVLTNRMDLPIVHRRNTEAPKRIESPFPDPNSTRFVDSIEQMIDNSLNMAPVQRGEAVKRGEAAQAYAIRRDSADTPIQAVIDEDRLGLQDLFSGTLHEKCGLDRPESQRVLCRGVPERRLGWGTLALCLPRGESFG